MQKCMMYLYIHANMIIYVFRRTEDKNNTKIINTSSNNKQRTRMRRRCYIVWIYGFISSDWASKGPPSSKNTVLAHQ